MAAEYLHVEEFMHVERLHGWRLWWDRLCFYSHWSNIVHDTWCRWHGCVEVPCQYDPMPTWVATECARCGYTTLYLPETIMEELSRRIERNTL